MSVLLFVLVGVAPSCALGVVIYRFIRSMKILFVAARADSVRLQARAEAAEQAAEVAEGRRAEAAGLAAESAAATGQALHVARQIDKVSTQMDTLIGCITGETAVEPHHHGRHALPGGADLQAITSTQMEFLP